MKVKNEKNNIKEEQQDDKNREKNKIKKEQEDDKNSAVDQIKKKYGFSMSGVSIAFIAVIHRIVFS